jgi:endogenous inhibitor of DNA gyrase (YacG/DUF329 family)
MTPILRPKTLLETVPMTIHDTGQFPSGGSSGWLRRTSQRWKVLVFLATLAVAGLGLCASYALLNESILDDTGLILLGLGSGVLGCAALAWIAMAVKCPACRGRPVWYLLRTAPVSGWLTSILFMRECPLCRDTSIRHATPPFHEPVQRTIR